MIPLTNTERRWAQTALVTIFPSGVHPRVQGADVIDGGQALEGVCQRVPARVALGLRAAVWIFALSPLLVLRRFRTLSSLDPAKREQVVLELLSYRVYFVRQLALLLKAFGALLFIAARGVREGIVRREPVVQLRPSKEARHVA
jgi:hypothetical protein